MEESLLQAFDKSRRAEDAGSRKFKVFNISFLSPVVTQTADTMYSGTVESCIVSNE